jgi:hypothetical protein
MMKLELALDGVVFGIVMKAIAGEEHSFDQGARCAYWLRQMQSQGIEISMAPLTSFLAALGNEGNAEELHNRFQAITQSQSCDTLFYSTAIGWLTRLQRIHWACEILEALPPHVDVQRCTYALVKHANPPLPAEVDCLHQTLRHVLLGRPPVHPFDRETMAEIERLQGAALLHVHLGAASTAASAASSPASSGRTSFSVTSVPGFTPMPFGSEASPSRLTEDQTPGPPRRQTKVARVLVGCEDAEEEPELLLPGNARDIPLTAGCSPRSQSRSRSRSASRSASRSGTPCPSVGSLAP